MTLDDVKVGDLVLHYSRHNWSCPTLKKVQRVTKSQIIINDQRGDAYRKKDGKEVGQSGEYHWAYIEIPTAEQVAEIQERNKRNKIMMAIEESDLTKLSTEQLEEILALCQRGKAE